ncbi:WD40 repeat-like protein [Eremomyces bilateralis CBS 781.70]|uniref:WD40 repeat-like protein n=1 Tax=Eremomyces bilateralis CBS 781.70 TaxID=1392243 RepID=A0A6G1GFN0_9PEZI|nr:WD40 repeat-like protein [Eremomyces bilateralis CBS 781.70]KAF1816726.1 WD40 repeat-like protein [Eremomyces bilateralis CBS 781.70]
MAFEDDEENGSGSSSDEDQDEQMMDADNADDGADAEADAEGDGEEDADGDNDDDDDDGDNDDDDHDQEDADSQGGAQSMKPPARPPTSMPNGLSPRHQPNANGVMTNGDAHPEDQVKPPTPQGNSTPIPFRPSVRPEMLTAPTYDIIPTIAAPHSTSINAVCSTSDMRWVFTAGTDGYIRKFNWVDTANGKLALTVAQRHPFVDSVTKAGVLLSYWDNEEAPDRTPLDEDTPPSPIYSLAVHHQGLWILSGLENGGINLQSVRHNEGTRIAALQKHTSAVSVLSLADDETSVLSGSWDKTIVNWDLNTGQVVRTFEGSGSQISAIERRPQSSLPVPEELASYRPVPSSTFSSNYDSKPSANGFTMNGTTADDHSLPREDRPSDVLPNGEDPPGGSPSLNSLFGDEDDEFSRAIANGIQANDDEDAEGDANMQDAGGPVQPPTQDTADQTLPNGERNSPVAEAPPTNDGENLNGHEKAQESGSWPNGLPLSDEPRHAQDATDSTSKPIDSNRNTFLDASIDGTIRIWDQRQQNPIARILPGPGVPPWCMNACWSPDGNFIYAGRRNNTVEEYSLAHGLKAPSRTFKFPYGSGAVSAIKAMPNGKHLVCASHDILRLYDLKDQEETKTRHSVVPFLIIPGHRTGVISQLYIDPSCTFMISTAGNRGWEGNSTEVLLGYEIGASKA